MSRRDGRILRLQSSYRTATAAETLARATALMPRLGISRNTCITRLDRLGLPVYASVRPRSRSLGVHAGKGVEPLEARVGALMEAIEFAVAEVGASATAESLGTVRDVATRLAPFARFVDLVPRIGVEIDVDEPVSAVPCEVLGRDETVPVPAELVFFPYEPRSGRTLFGADTNGLASGNSIDEATLHGLFEVMERDALSMNLADDRSIRVDDDSLPEPFRSMASSWRALGVELAVRSIPNAFGYACFEAFLRESGDDRLRLAEGSGLHVDRRVALARAVCEAAQSRASHVHGGREDAVLYYRPHDDDGRIKHRREDVERRAFDRQDAVDFRSLPDAGGKSESIRTLLVRVQARLGDAGFPTVLRHRFAIDLDGLCVVKVIVPKLENVEHRPANVGPRLFAAITGRA